MREAQFEYKCRRCGTVFTEGLTGTKKAESSLLEYISGLIPIFDVGIFVDKHVHSVCDLWIDEGKTLVQGQGIADLIGIRFVYEEDERG